MTPVFPIHTSASDNSTYTSVFRCRCCFFGEGLLSFLLFSSNTVNAIVCSQFTAYKTSQQRFPEKEKCVWLVSWKSVDNVQNATTSQENACSVVVTGAVTTFTGRKKKPRK
jgi:ABC-type glycerol-3-phosphate transport system permease component